MCNVEYLQRFILLNYNKILKLVKIIISSVSKQIQQVFYTENQTSQKQVNQGFVN